VFHVAQTDIADDDRATMSDLPHVVDHSARLHDFGDTAALLAQMDLVISVDTALAHLGGGLGHRVWTMLPFGADYRWMTDGTTSPWYPTMRLFRQAAFDDWDSVLQAVARELDTLVP
jgi:ADP-heptose:LPS heptosyltransferase